MHKLFYLFLFIFMAGCQGELLDGGTVLYEPSDREKEIEQKGEKNGSKNLDFMYLAGSQGKNGLDKLVLADIRTDSDGQSRACWYNPKRALGETRLDSLIRAQPLHRFPIDLDIVAKASIKVRKEMRNESLFTGAVCVAGASFTIVSFAPAVGALVKASHFMRGAHAAIKGARLFNGSVGGGKAAVGITLSALKPFFQGAMGEEVRKQLKLQVLQNAKRMFTKFGVKQGLRTLWSRVLMPTGSLIDPIIGLVGSFSLGLGSCGKDGRKLLNDWASRESGREAEKLIKGASTHGWDSPQESLRHAQHDKTIDIIAAAVKRAEPLGHAKTEKFPGGCRPLQEILKDRHLSPSSLTYAWEKTVVAR